MLLAVIPGRAKREPGIHLAPKCVGWAEARFRRAHHRQPSNVMTCSGDVPGDGLARGALTSRSPSNVCGDVSARQLMVSRCVEMATRVAS